MGAKVYKVITVFKLSEDMSDVDVEIKCLSCRKDEPDSGALTKHFFSSAQSKLKVDSDFFVCQICFNLLSFYSGVQKGAQDVFGRHSSSNVPRGRETFFLSHPCCLSFGLFFNTAFY